MKMATNSALLLVDCDADYSRSIRTMIGKAVGPLAREVERMKVKWLGKYRDGDKNETYALVEVVARLDRADKIDEISERIYSQDYVREVYRTDFGDLKMKILG